MINQVLTKGCVCVHVSDSRHICVCMCVSVCMYIDTRDCVYTAVGGSDIEIRQ